MKEVKNSDKYETKYPCLILKKDGTFDIYIKQGQKIVFTGLIDLKEFINENECVVYIEGIFSGFNKAII